MLLAYVDWSRLDRMEEPEFGTKRQQLHELTEINQAAALVAANDGSGSVVKLTEESLLDNQHAPRLTSPDSPASPHSATVAAGASGGNASQMMTLSPPQPQQRATSEQQNVALNSRSLTLNGANANKFRSALGRVLRTYQSVDDLDENGDKPMRYSRIVVPLEGDSSRRQREWILPRARSSSVGDRRPPNPNEFKPMGHHAEQPTPAAQLESPSPLPPVAQTPSLRAQSELFDISLNGHSLTLADARHYQHEIKRVDIESMLGGGSGGDGSVDGTTPKKKKEGAILEWYDLQYSVPVMKDGKKVQRKLLNNVFGMCKPGLMVALSDTQQDTQHTRAHMPIDQRV